jgi:hypothetical protein
MKMKKLLLTLMLAVVSSSAMAEWVEVEISADGNTAIYANPATLQKKDERVKMWTLLDHKIVQGDADFQYMSTKQQFEFECKEVQFRGLQLIGFTNNMGKGNVVFSGNIDDSWRPVSPDSKEEKSWKYACGK